MEKTKAAGRGGPGFAFVVPWVALVAASGTGVCVLLSLHPWLLFLGWVAFATGANPKASVQVVACALLGLILGMAGATLLGSISALGVWALLIAVFSVTSVAMLSILVPPVNSVVGYFLGMIAFFASGLKPGVEQFIELAIPVAIGGIAGWLASTVAHKIQHHAASRV